MSAPASPPVVELRVWGVDRVTPALLRMAAGPRSLRGTPGVRFAKLLGTGAGRTFTPRDADPHHWALLSVHDAATPDLVASSPLVQRWSRDAREELVVRLAPITSRGLWSGVEPFGPDLPDRGRAHDGPVAAITRARLRTARTPSFWRALPPVVEALADAPGARLSLGMGEAPVGLQGTFSLWRSEADLRAFAHGAAHRAVIGRTRPERWYAEELFARLRVLDVTGTYRGQTP